MDSTHSLTQGLTFIARNKRRLHKYGIIIAFFVLCLVVTIIGEVQVANGAWSNNYFLSNENMLIVLRQISINGILAIGMTFVIITAGVDLSVGSVLALGAIEAIKGANLNVKDFALAGVDGVSDAIRAVQAGEMVSILQDAHAQMQGSIDVALHAVKGDSYQPQSDIWKQYAGKMNWDGGKAKRYSVPWTKVTPQNAAQLLDARK